MRSDPPTSVLALFDTKRWPDKRGMQKIARGEFGAFCDLFGAKINMDGSPDALGAFDGGKTAEPASQLPRSSGARSVRL